MKKGDRPLFHFMKKGSVPFFLLLAVVCASAAACGDVDVYINTNPTTTLPRVEAPVPPE